MQPAGEKVGFLNSDVASVGGSATCNLEPALPVAEFRRYSNNIGWWEPDAPTTLMEFARWTHEATRGHMMVVDLQGVRTANGWLLTDPCVLCNDVTRFGSGNLGPYAIMRCLATLARRLDTPSIPSNINIDQPVIVAPEN